jgi:hypothetical protein
VSERKQLCPICSAEVMPMSRYPDYACNICVSQAVDLNGNKVDFANEDLSGGLIGFRQNPATGFFEEDPDLTDNPEILINGTKCIAREAHFGGIVIRPIKND